MFNVEIDLKWFIISEAVIALHPLTNSLTTLLLLRPYRRAFKKVCPYVIVCYDARRKQLYSNIGEPTINQSKKEVETDSSGHSHSINANVNESSAVSL